MPKPQTERLGVSALEHFFAEQGWLFREQVISDYGVDAQVEIVEGNYPSGKLIGLQIKSGVSYFEEKSGDFYVFRPDTKHVDYWLNLSIPMVLVLYDPKTKSAHVQPILKRTLKKAGRAWKILVPRANAFESPIELLKQLTHLTQPPSDVRRLNRLRADRKWMELLDNGSTVVLTFDDWANKSLPRYQLNLKGGGYKETWPTVYSPGTDVEAMLEHYFPWASFQVDLEAHREGSEGQYEADCYMCRDSDTGEAQYFEEFDEWYVEPTGLVPVSEDGEVAHYRLLLSLNEFGENFLQIDDFLLDPSIRDSIGFEMRG